MSHLGQKQTFPSSAQCPLSANSRHLRLFDPLVGVVRSRHGNVARLERVHPLVLTHKQLDRVLSEIEAYFF